MDSGLAVRSDPLRQAKKAVSQWAAGGSKTPKARGGGGSEGVGFRDRRWRLFGRCLTLYPEFQPRSRFPLRFRQRMSRNQQG
jgi:hypothetical protein